MEGGRKKALITGVTGQDGSYLAEILLNKGYEVHGLVRRSSSWNRGRIDHIHSNPDHDVYSVTPDHKERFFLHYGDLTDPVSLTNVLARVRPDEIYNLAAQSHVHISFETPVYTAHTTGLGVLHLLEAMRSLGLNSKMYQASTSELYSGDEREAPQNEVTPFKPRSPYGVAKLYGFEIARTYRESYGMFVVNGILFNHESERRGENFVSRKITQSIGEILKGKKEHIFLGNLRASRDWGYAPEYMEAAWRMLQHEAPEDFVIATGETHTVEEFAREACMLAGLDYTKIIKVADKYVRPNEVNYLRGDASKAKRILGWEPKTRFKDLVKIMVEHDSR